jgi:hypothetical protein
LATAQSVIAREGRAALPVLSERRSQAWAAPRARPDRLPLRVDGHPVLLGGSCCVVV